MDAILTKKNGAIAGLSLAIANFAVAFGWVDATVAALSQGALSSVAALVLYLLHRRDNAV